MFEEVSEEDEFQSEPNRTETAKRQLQTLIPLHSVSQLYILFSQSSPPPDTKPVFTDTLLAVYAESKLPNEAIELYSLVRNDGSFPSIWAFNFFLESLVNTGRFSKTLEIFSDAVDSDGWVDKFSYAKAVQFAVKLGDLVKGLDLMNRMKKCGIMPNGFVYNVLIGGLCKEKRVDDAKKLFDEMLRRNVFPNRVTYNTLIDGCNTLPGGLCKMGRMEEANRILEEMAFYGLCGNVEASVALYEDAMKKGVSLNEYTCSILMNGLCKEGKMDRAKEFLTKLKEHGVVLTEVLLNTMVNGYCKVGNVDKALLPSYITYNTIISHFCALGQMDDANESVRKMKAKGLCPNGRIVEAKVIFEDMLNRNVLPNAQIYNMLIDGNCMRGNIKDAFAVFDEMLRSRISPTIVTYNSLVNGLSKKGRVAEAEELAFSITSKGLSADVITYNCLISGFSRLGNVEKCVELYEKMKASCIKPTLNTYHPLISACKKDKIDLVEKILEDMSRLNLTPDRVVYNELIQCFVWHGDIQKANVLCGEMSNLGILPDKLTYNSLITGCLKEGNLHGSKDLFDDMIAKEVVPNDGTFNTLIEGHCKVKDFDGASVCVSVCNELVSGLRDVGRVKEAEIICSEMSMKGVCETLHEDLLASPVK
ncbi:hypothetical protein ABFS83_10G092400 [Erythranthe nasuta]